LFHVIVYRIYSIVSRCSCEVFISTFRAAYNQGRIIFFFSLSKGTDDAQSFLGYVFFDQTLISHSILFSTTCTSVSAGIMMNRRQL